MYDTPMHMRAVIFDMDGLMIDTEPLYREAWRRACAEYGYILSDAAYGKVKGRTFAGAESVLREEFGSAFSFDVFEDTCRKHEQAIFNRDAITQKQRLEGLLAFLESRFIPKAVATSTDRKMAAGLLEWAGLLNRFETLAGGDEVANGKPSPDLFLLAAHRLGISPHDCLVLEDAEPGVIAARRAGMRVYVVPDMAPASATIERLAHGIFQSLDEVAEHLQLRLSGEST